MKMELSCQLNDKQMKVHGKRTIRHLSLDETEILSIQWRTQVAYGNETSAM